MSEYKVTLSILIFLGPLEGISASWVGVEVFWGAKNLVYPKYASSNRIIKTINPPKIMATFFNDLPLSSAAVFEVMTGAGALGSFWAGVSITF